MPYCRSCGKEVSATAAFCTHCGQAQRTAQPAVSKNLGDDPGMRLLIPVGRSGWAIASGYLGLLSLIVIPAPFALITGLLAVRDIRRNTHKHGMGRAVFGITMGILSSALLLLSLALRS